MNYREVKLFLPNGEVARFALGDPSDYGVITKIWVSREPYDLFVRLGTADKAIDFKGIPYMIMEKNA